MAPEDTNYLVNEFLYQSKTGDKYSDSGKTVSEG